jgi:hypothetical protein
MSIFAKRHYLRILAALVNCEAPPYVVDHFIKIFKYDNPKFNEMLFRKSLAELQRGD